jgi:hypothetical protein
VRALALVALIGCSNLDVVGHAGGGGGAGGGTGGAGGSGGGGGAAATICGGRIAEQTFRYALCSCGPATIQNLHTDTVDAVSSATSRFGAAVGMTGNYMPGGGQDIGGSLDVSGDLTLPGMSSINGDLEVGGALGGGDRSQVARDAWIVGPVSLPGNGLSVGRDLYAPAMQAPQGIQVGGSFHSQNFAMNAPCDCGRINIAAIVAQVRDQNDNGAITLATDRLISVANTDDVILPAGRFYLQGISGPGSATIHVSSRTMVMIGGDVDIGGLTFDVGSTGEIDVFIAGLLEQAGNIDFGSSNRPAASRYYVAGGQTINLPNNLNGNLYAPTAQVASSNQNTYVHGSIFAASISVNNLLIHYDAAIGDAAGSSCEPVTNCATSNDCTGGNACMGGACGACQIDGDCASPLVCATGHCIPLKL